MATIRCNRPRPILLPTSGKGITVIAVANGDTSGNAAQRLGQVGSHTRERPAKLSAWICPAAPTSTSNGGAGFRFNNGASLYDTPVSNAGFHIVTWQVDDATKLCRRQAVCRRHVAGQHIHWLQHRAQDTTSFTGIDLELILGTGRSAQRRFAYRATITRASWPNSWYSTNSFPLARSISSQTT